jgi:hypothetical protein
MAETLQQRIANCKRRMAVIRSLIEEQHAAGLSSNDAERVLALEAEFLKMLEVQLSAGRHDRDD